MDSSFDGEGTGSERRSPRERSVSLDWDLPCLLCLGMKGLLEPCPKEGAERVAAGMDIDGCKDDEDVEDDEAEDRVITPATGMRTMQRWRLSKA